MIDRLTNAIKTHSSSLDQTSGQAKFGIVTSVNAQTATARVTIQPDGVLSGWLPVLSQWIGNGWGMVCPLDPGDQVLVVPQEGDVEQGVIVGRAYSVNQTPPPAPADEFWMVHKSGSSLKLCNDGTVRINGDLHVQGDVYDSHGALSHLRASYDQHTHPTPPNNRTGLPSPQD